MEWTLSLTTQIKEQTKYHKILKLRRGLSLVPVLSVLTYLEFYHTYIYLDVLAIRGVVRRINENTRNRGTRFRGKTLPVEIALFFDSLLFVCLNIRIKILELATKTPRLKSALHWVGENFEKGTTILKAQ